MIERMRNEIQSLRSKERDYRRLQDQLLNLEQSFGRLNEERRSMDDDYKGKVENNIQFIQQLRSEVDDERNIYNERKKQHAGLNS